MNNNSMQVTNDEQPSAQAAVQIQTTPVVQDEAPTSNAELSIEATKTNFKAEMSVPGPNAGQMINAATRILGLAGSVVGPAVVLKFSANLVMPWYGVWALVVVVAVLPLVHVVVGNRHDKQQ
ncbi:hypothetical protein AQJ66_36455 [Streptomyces bungoensis]|uniref:Uncharacterized protein n=1 Tax=Streptomyces bungoensis TaxID=285568 RepID=A0A101SIW4_9ACTN|nr:hypothetical protein [Streptomyces bungoensis]KUN75102.1 hypothetical protein AQJ66_36455 [Streptomyces bungoensis]